MARIDEPVDTTTAANTTVHPCPYCKTWQVDYHSETMHEWVQIRIEPDADGVLQPVFDTKPWYTALDEVVSEHMMDKHLAAYRFFLATGRPLPATH